MSKKRPHPSERAASGLRDDMAVYRTEMANQRTFLAFLALSLHFIALALTVAEIQEFERYAWAAVPLAIVGATLFLIGVLNYYRIKRKVHRDNTEWINR